MIVLYFYIIIIIIIFFLCGEDAKVTTIFIIKNLQTDVTF